MVKRDAYMVKRYVKESNLPYKIDTIHFSLLNGNEMERLSSLRVTSRDLFSMPSHNPSPNGVLDPRLGISTKNTKCGTCDKDLAACAGHYGHIQLELPVFHLGYIKLTVETLQMICKSCSRVLLLPEERVRYLRRIANMTDLHRRLATRKQIIGLCKRQNVCPYCHALNGTVKKLPGAHTLKIVHEKYNSKTASDAHSLFLAQFKECVEHNKEIEVVLQKAPMDLSPLVVLELFQKIIDSDCPLLLFDSQKGRPEKLILTSVLVPPVCIRPSVVMDTGEGTNEDDLTAKLQEIIQVNSALQLALSKGASVKTLMEDWDFLQVQIAQLINGEMPGLPKPVGYTKPIQGYCQRLKGKHGRFRGNLSGKRVDFSGRTVISPDPNLEIDQVGGLSCEFDKEELNIKNNKVFSLGIPIHVAKVMTYPEVVTRSNINKCKQLIRNGPSVHPGANAVLSRKTGFSRNLSYAISENVVKDLHYGDVIERHMEDDDIVLFNRQPSLHKMSIMSHRAKIMQWRTFRFNECVCAPYNADFDGDEMNLHLPQTEEARAEARMLMNVKENLITPRNGEPLVAATQDFLTASYLLTQKNIFYNKEEFCQIVSFMGDGIESIDLPSPSILKPMSLWTGKQVIGMLLRPNQEKQMSVSVTFELKERNYSDQLHLCRNDGYVCFIQSELISGNLCKRTLGDGSKKGLFYVLIRDYGINQAARCMNRLAKLCSRWLGSVKGFSIGIDDVMPSKELSKKKEALLKEGYTKSDDVIKDYEQGTLTLKPGCNSLQSLESELNGLLGKIRETAGAECMKALPFVNNPRIMADCGSKGSALNISQMVTCVGQQSVNGKRIPEGFLLRSLPHFKPNELAPKAKGFVSNSFYTGLTATEFFFHTMGGREGLVDTAVKTAETGYMARRLMKALEDLSCQYDSTIRNSENCVVQLVYGDDGLNPSFMEDNDRPVDFARLFRTVQLEDPPLASNEWLSAHEIREIGKKILNSIEFQRVKTSGRKFVEEVNEFFQGLARQIDEESSRINGATKDTDIVHNIVYATASQLYTLAQKAYHKYCVAVVEPGEAVGAIGAQSISEPGTQMTLKTFHFAGVASMNVTLGVPRLKEIINASKAISTPIITAALAFKNEEKSARIVKGRIEKTTLGQVAKSISQLYDQNQAYVKIVLDMDLINSLQLDITAQSVRHSLIKKVGVKTRSVLRLLKEENIVISADDNHVLRVFPPSKYAKSNAWRGVYFVLQVLMTALPTTIVQGISTVSRAVINYEETKSNIERSFHLLVEGYGLLNVMGVPGIDGSHTTSNHVAEVEGVLGIEAARKLISDEVSYIMKAYGIGIDTRHLKLLSDVMTFKGTVFGITRFGISKMRESVLMLASFEQTTDHLFAAAAHARMDKVVGVSECIIMGIPVPLGTGLFKLLQRVEHRQECNQHVPLF